MGCEECGRKFLRKSLHRYEGHLLCDDCEPRRDHKSSRERDLELEKELQQRKEREQQREKERDTWTISGYHFTCEVEYWSTGGNTARAYWNYGTDKKFGGPGKSGYFIEIKMVPQNYWLSKKIQNWIRQVRQFKGPFGPGDIDQFWQTGMTGQEKEILREIRVCLQDELSGIPYVKQRNIQINHAPIEEKKPKTKTKPKSKKKSKTKTKTKLTEELNRKKKINGSPIPTSTELLYLARKLSLERFMENRLHLRQEKPDLPDIYDSPDRSGKIPKVWKEPKKKKNRKKAIEKKKAKEAYFKIKEEEEKEEKRALNALKDNDVIKTLIGGAYIDQQIQHLEAAAKVREVRKIFGKEHIFWTSFWEMHKTEVLALANQWCGTTYTWKQKPNLSLPEGLTDKQIEHWKFYFDIARTEIVLKYYDLNVPKYPEIKSRIDDEEYTW